MNSNGCFILRVAYGVVSGSTMRQTLQPPPSLPPSLQSLNHCHQRSVDLFADALEAIFLPLESRLALSFRLTSLYERMELVILGGASAMRRAALR